MSYDIKDFNMNFFSLKGKNAIVTGGNQGLGQSFALALAKAGANILCVALADDNGQTKEMIESEGVSYHLVTGDITTEGFCKHVVEKCVEIYGSVDILVNNAGICLLEEDVLKFGMDKWDKMNDINLRAPYELIHECAKFMIPQKSGKIINICSMFSYLGGKWSPAYTATKTGLAGVTRTMADELAGFGINVNGIAPGYYATEITTATRANPETNQRVLDHISANRWGERQDLMGAAVFLASDAANYVNGILLDVDGGYRLR